MATKRTNEEQTCTLILRICRLLNSRSITIKGCNVMYFKKKLKVRKKRHICKLSEFTVILHYRVIFQLKICFFNATTVEEKRKQVSRAWFFYVPKRTASFPIPIQIACFDFPGTLYYTVLYNIKLIKRAFPVSQTTHDKEWMPLPPCCFDLLNSRSITIRM